MLRQLGVVISLPLDCGDLALDDLVEHTWCAIDGGAWLRLLLLMPLVDAHTIEKAQLVIEICVLDLRFSFLLIDRSSSESRMLERVSAAASLILIRWFGISAFRSNLPELYLRFEESLLGLIQSA